MCVRVEFISLVITLTNGRVSIRAPWVVSDGRRVHLEQLKLVNSRYGSVGSFASSEGASRILNAINLLYHLVIVCIGEG